MPTPNDTPKPKGRQTPLDRFQQAVKQILAVPKSALPSKTAKKK